MKRGFIKNIVFIIITTLIMLVKIGNISYADVGSFESYSSGSSSSGGGYSSSSWGGSSYSSRGGYSSVSDGADWFVFVVFIIMVVYVLFKQKRSNDRRPQSRSINNTHEKIIQTKSEAQIEAEIKTHDELFNKEEIVAWSKTLFVKLQQAWTKREWAEIRPFETDKLFEQHKSQLQGYIDNNQINVMDRICVNYANLYDYKISGDKEILVIKLNSRMQDYIIDATTKKVLRGDPSIERTNSYLLTFERKYGVQTKPGTMELDTTNCPNCGAPTKITSSGECEYCGSIVTIGEYNWCLANLERAQY